MSEPLDAVRDTAERNDVVNGSLTLKPSVSKQERKRIHMPFPCQRSPNSASVGTSRQLHRVMKAA
jgi:hypothetical protein